MREERRRYGSTSRQLAGQVPRDALSRRSRRSPACCPCAVRTGMTRDFTRFSNANRPAVCPDGELVAVSTEHHDASQHFLSVLSGGAAAQRANRAGALACYQPMPELMTDVKWLDATRMVVASGRGSLSVHQVESATTLTRTIRTTGQYHTYARALVRNVRWCALVRGIGMASSPRSRSRPCVAESLRAASSSYIREVATCPESSGRVAYGGYDCAVSVTDLHRPSERQLHLSVPSVVSSVKWASIFSGTVAKRMRPSTRQ